MMVHSFYEHILKWANLIKGNIDYYFNKNKKWGVMTRKGLSKK